MIFFPYGNYYVLRVFVKPWLQAVLWHDIRRYRPYTRSTRPTCRPYIQIRYENHQTSSKLR